MKSQATARWETLMARDGHQFAAYLAPATGTPRGAVVVLQEIFERIHTRHVGILRERFSVVGSEHSLPPSKTCARR